ncbi:MAG: TonB-dependent receptor [Lewinellaceae bacterium]|nr:TonB-dependent receptor [Saprospiraceae bacterium]MCB9315968.1 TonB-dependent receptor [Lewinellaceae bacterium]MCB9330103.1 TonB-dependent receptor [Lewinellaceae bacterium]
MFQKLFLAGLLLTTQLAIAQTGTLQGKVMAADNNAPVADASVVLAQTGLFAATDRTGAFTLFNVPAGEHTLIVSRVGYLPTEQKTTVEAGQDMLLNIALERDPNATSTNVTDIPTITLDEAETESEGIGEIANLLHASRDVFQNASSFGWSVFRFRERGYDSEFFPIYLNGISINDPETGIAFFSEFGGLNDVLRVRQSVIGMEAAEFAFSEIGGATHIDTRASVQRKQIRASYAISNRTYTNRVMVTASTGLMPGGWAVSVSGSRRWAQEGWHEGTFFDGYGYFLSVDKKFGDKHSLNLTVLGSPNSRGRVGDTFQEMFDLAGTTRYNPNWGYWNGEKRNAAVSHGHQPIVLLRYDLKPSRATNLMLAAYSQFGQNGYTRLDWFEANSPEPDYNRRLPSALENPEQIDAWAQYLRENESARQIDWVGIWEANTINTATIQNANGIQGNTISGKRSQYVIGDSRSDTREAGFNAVLRQALGDRFVLNGGANYQWYRGKNFKTVDDILGGDFIVDLDRFVDDPLAANNDLQITNHVVREGEIYGYNYDENIRSAGSWVQLQGNLPRISFFAAAENMFTEFWRTGYMQNGRFPDASLGDSEKVTFFNYGLKAGITYKITGRQYLYANSYYGTRAQRFRDVFISPRIRDHLVTPKPESYTIYSFEGGLQWRAPRFKARATGYYTQTDNEYENYLTFSPASSVFGSRSMVGVDRLHTGVELAFEARPLVAWTISAAANLGRYVYTSRPYLVETEDNTADVAYAGTAYIKNFFVPRTPQTAASASLKYEAPQFWFATLTLNWADNFYYLFDQRRRTADYVATIPEDSDLWRFIIDQQKAPAAFTLDFFGGKSWRFNRNTFVYLTVGVNNLLNNTNIINSGRDATRNAFRDDFTDIRLYTNQLIYAPGTNYFISLALRI